MILGSKITKTVIAQLFLVYTMKIKKLHSLMHQLGKIYYQKPTPNLRVRERFPIGWVTDIKKKKKKTTHSKKINSKKNHKYFVIVVHKLKM